MGPCVAAASTGRLHHLVDLPGESAFRTFAAVAADHGVRSSLSVPIAGAHRGAALKLYASESGSFRDDRPRAIAALLARCHA